MTSKIGHTARATPSSAAETAMPTGISKAKTAMTNAMIAAIGHAFHPAIFKNPNATIRNSIGSKASRTIQTTLSSNTMFHAPNRQVAHS